MAEAVAAEAVGGVAAPPGAVHEYVMLVSSEGCEFVLDRESAEQSRMIREMLQVGQFYGAAAAPPPSAGDACGGGGPRAAIVHRLPLEDIGAPVLSLVCQYLAERRACRHSMADFHQLKALDPKKESDRQLVFELLLAADYLEC